MATEPFRVITTTAYLRLNNNSDQFICYVYISPSDQTTWGDDWLGGATVHPYGYGTGFTVDFGMYDLKAENCSHTPIDTRYSQHLYSGETYIWNIDNIYVPFTLNNNSGQSVCYVYISPSTQTTWGDDWLGANLIFSGESHTFSVLRDIYDLKAEDCSHNIIDTRWSQFLSGSYIWNIGP
jgi:hypothetical protein